LLEPTRIYVKPVLELLQQIPIKGIAHITGGGLLENIPRILPRGLTAVIDSTAWKHHSIFNWLQTSGNIDTHEMYRTFNCGIGMILVIGTEQVETAIDMLTASGEHAWLIGTVNESTDERRVKLLNLK
jgi:phosphoribosylformylglycinamidine cyclo-ligase